MVAFRFGFIGLIMLCTILARAQSPTLGWAKSMGGSDIDAGHSVVLDASGNIYTVGRFAGGADFDPGAGTFNLSAGANPDIFISKLDASGNFVWAKSMGAIQDDQGTAIALDASGNVYTTGYFQGTVDFDPGAGVFNLTSAGSFDIFVCKLDASGNFVWAKGIGSTDGDVGRTLVVDGAGNVYISGFYSETVDFDPGAGVFNITSVGPGTDDIFVLKLDTSGNFVWAKSFGGDDNGDDGSSIAMDASGNLYITGFFQLTADFDPGAGVFNLTSSGGEDIFVTKLDPSGNFVWAKRIGGTDDDNGLSISIDNNSGDVYAAGFFSEITDFDPGTGTFNLTPDGDDIFIVKLDVAGNFVWAKSMGGDDDERAQGIKIDATGNVYTTGRFGGICDFDPGSGTFNLTASAYDIYISKLDPSGNFVWAVGMGSTSIDQGRAIAVSSSGDVYTTGSYIFTVDFDPGAGTFDLTYSGNAGNTDVYVQKLTNSATPLPTITSFTPGSGPVSTVVTITGTNFSSTPVNNSVRFNGTLTTATASSATSITTTVPNGASTGPITVTVSGNTATSATDFTVTGPSIIFTTQPSNRSICGSVNTSFSVVAGGDTNLQYQWQIDNSGFTDLANNATYSGVSTSTLSIANPSPSLNGSVYRCLVRGDNTGDTPSASAVLTINTFPGASISLDGTFLMSTAGDSYQWYQNGNIIPGETSQSFELNVLEYGEYTVEVTTNGCSSMSLEFTYLITGTEQSHSLIKIFPNPVDDELRIEAPENAEVSLTITNVTGKTVRKFEQANQSVDIADLPPGIYMVHIKTSKKVEIKKIVKR